MDASMTYISDAAAPELTVVVPMYNEAANLSPLVARLTPVLERCVASYEIVFVDDVSIDETLMALRQAHLSDPRLRAVSFSRNFGKEAALTAGLDQTCGEAVIILDADLQDPPELVTEMVAQWRAGFDVVFEQTDWLQGWKDATIMKAMTSGYRHTHARGMFVGIRS